MEWLEENRGAGVKPTEGMKIGAAITDSGYS
jgi:hypothetical protein